MLDAERMLELEGEFGSEDLAFILAAYFEEAEDALARMEAGLGPDDHRRALHFLRSGALNIGLRGIAFASGEADGGGAGPAAQVVHLRGLLERSRAEVAGAGRAA